MFRLGLALHFMEIHSSRWLGAAPPEYVIIVFDLAEMRYLWVKTAHLRKLTETNSGSALPGYPDVPDHLELL